MMARERIAPTEPRWAKGPTRGQNSRWVSSSDTRNEGTCSRCGGGYHKAAESIFKDNSVINATRRATSGRCVELEGK